MTATARLTLNSPLLLGFEQIERTLDRLAKTGGDGYPPYNIEQIGQNGLCITLAVAGFAAGDLSVELQGHQLTIRGRQAETAPERLYLHRGIAARQFQKSFLLAEGLQVDGASLDNGLLHIALSRPAPQTIVRTIEIQGPAGSTDQNPTIDVERHDALEAREARI